MATSSSLPTTDIGTPDLYYGYTYAQQADWWENTADLIFPQSMITYGRMRHDPQLKAVVSAILLPILRATWVVDPAGCRDEVVQLVADDLGVGVLDADNKPGPARTKGVTWHRHLRVALYNQLVYGFMPFERRYRVDSSSPGGTRLDALGPRMPWTMQQIKTNRDGSMNWVRQNTQDIPLLGSRLVWYLNNTEGTGWTGVSALRACFGAWLLKHETWRVHATSIRRFGMGIPSVTAPAGATKAQVDQAQQLASAMRAGDQAGVGLPNGFTPSLVGLTGSVPDALGFMEYLDRVMAKQALASLIELGQTQTGSRALGETFMDLFLLALQAIADEAAENATSGQPGCPGIITDLVFQNWGENEPAPRIICTDVGTDYELSASAISQLTATGALQPDESLDAWIRKQWHLPERTTPWTPPPSKGTGGSGPNTSQPTQEPGTPPVPAPAEPAPVAASTTSPLLRRNLTKIEAASGFDPVSHQQDWQRALDNLMSAYSAIVHTQRTSLVDQVTAAMDAGKIGRLTQIAADSSHGASLLIDAMVSAWHAAARAMIGEAASQGVTIEPNKVKLPSLGTIAEGRASLAAAWLASQASSRSLRLIQPEVPVEAQAASVSNDVANFLAGLSSSQLRDHMGAALTAAQNAGRVAVLQAAPESAGTARYVASEILDRNTCEPCQHEDGHEFASFAAAAEAYPTGGYKLCAGDLRCRGTVVALWGDEGNG